VRACIPVLVTLARLTRSRSDENRSFLIHHMSLRCGIEANMLSEHLRVRRDLVAIVAGRGEAEAGAGRTVEDTMQRNELARRPVSSIDLVSSLWHGN
jgi:hypothetical protein